MHPLSLPGRTLPQLGAASPWEAGEGGYGRDQGPKVDSHPRDAAEMSGTFSETFSYKGS